MPLRRSATLLAFILFSFSLAGQIRFKPTLDLGTGFSNNNFYAGNYGLTIEKKIDIDKAIETGIFYHNFEFYKEKSDDFFQAFIQGTPLEIPWDTISHVRVSFNFFNIPAGFNYYFTPKFYATYKLGFNFFTKTNFSLVDAVGLEDPLEGVELELTDFEKSIFRKFYLNHTISFNYKLMRRFDFGLGVIFTPRGQFFRETPNDLYEGFNTEVSRYFTVSVHWKIYLFQIKSKSL